MTKRRAQLSVISVDRTAEVLEMRTRRMSYAAIGAQLGISAERARQVYSGALKARVSAAVDEHRLALTDLADLAVSELVGLATNTAVTPRTRVECWSAARGWAAELARLHGCYRQGEDGNLNAPPPNLAEVISQRVAQLRRQPLVIDTGEDSTA